VLIEGSDELLKEYNEQFYIELTVDPADQQKMMTLADGFGLVSSEENKWRIPFSIFELVIEQMREKKIRIIDLKKIEKSLEEIFLELVGGRK
jgi:ABC-type multidrug transport system ATPase subunit